VSVEQDFRDYIAAFNRDDRAAYGSYYADNVTLVIAGRTELHGREAIFDFYAGVKATTRRTIEIVRVLASDALIAAELVSEFLALEDMPDFAAGPMRKGDRLLINSFVFYELEHVKYRRIRSATCRRELRSFAETQETTVDG